jgi:hypothetical protein
MGNDRSKRRKGDTGRDGGGFVALPWSVLDCPSYARLSHPARSLLMEFARQFVRNNNGRLLASFAHLGPRGWKSKDVITRAKRELMDAGFIFETAKGQRPNKASWYAITWYALDKLDGYDAGVTAAFQRGEYRENGSQKNASLSPSDGRIGQSIGPSDGLKTSAVGPSDGPIAPHLGTFLSPSDGHHIDMPSACPVLEGVACR